MAIDRQLLESQISSLGNMSRWTSKKEVAHLPEVLAPDEQLHAMTKGLHMGFEYLVTVTSKRVLLLRKGIMGATKQIEIAPSQISSVAHRIGLLAGTIDIQTSGGKTAIDLVDKADVAEVSRFISELALVHNTSTN